MSLTQQRVQLILQTGSNERRTVRGLTGVLAEVSVAVISSRETPPAN